MTLRQEIEELIEAMNYVANDQKRNTDFSKGYNAAARNFAGDLKRILRDPEQPTAPSQRERIATAIMLEMIRNSTNPDFMYATFASPAVTAADALIAELNNKK